MLPERISNDLCSLRELEDRPCLAVRKWSMTRTATNCHHEVYARHDVFSAAKLSYQQAQAAIDGQDRRQDSPVAG